MNRATSGGCLPKPGITLAALIVLGTTLAITALMMTAGGGTAPIIAQVQVPAPPPTPTAVPVTDVCSNTAAIPDPEDPNLIADCNALWAAKATLEGAGRLSNWLTTNLINSWYGVEVGVHITSTRVMTLALASSSLIVGGNNRLGGRIPPELGNLSQLRHLSIDDSNMTGTIPAALGRLSQLRNLWFPDNGPNPDSNQAPIRNRPNGLRGSIPPELGNLSNLAHLRLNHNRLTGTIPAALGNLSNLTILHLAKNSLTGPIPPALGNLTNLTGLYLDRNQLTGTIPAELGNLTNLGLLALRNNRLTGTIPYELGNLTNLQRLYLNHNRLTGVIPETLGNLTNLAHLHLHANRLTGVIPAELGNLSQLRELRLHYNRLSGSIPPELGNLSLLLRLYLYNNQLTGAIPAQLGSLTGLLGNGVILGNHGSYAYTNSFSGCIISSLHNKRPNVDKTSTSDQSSPSYLPVCSTTPPLAPTSTPRPCANSYAIPDPEQPGMISDCETLLAAKPTLEGDPASLDWSTIRTINSWEGISVDSSRVITVALDGALRDGNRLTGSRIPAQLGSLSALRELRLSGHSLTGKIPAALGDLSNLRTLNLYSNTLTGKIPPQLAALSHTLTTLNLGQNRLTGEIPSELSTLTNLQTLNLYSNTLTGTIPADLGNLSNLRQLNLSTNQLTGTIPPELSTLTKLQTLNLEHNQLTGTIPPELGNLPTNAQILLIASMNATNNFEECHPFSDRTDLRVGSLRMCTPGSNPCYGSVAIPGWSTTESRSLVADCNALVGAKDTLRGSTLLNWYTTTLITAWDGISFDDNDSPTQVITLDLSSNTPPLAGSIPAALGALTNLQTLNLYSNTLTGKIPSQLGNLSTTLTTLNLSTNQLSGSIPSALGNLVTLQTLNLANNRLSGSIPTALGNLSTNLQTLNLYTNTLTGTIPAQLGQLTNLQTLRLNGNQLSSTIPSALDRLSRLTHLYLGGSNTISGCISRDLNAWRERGDTHTDIVLLECTPTPVPRPPSSGGGGGGGGSTPRPRCTNGTVVANPSANADLVRDCVLLLTIKATLEGRISASMRLNWSENSSIDTWEGVTIDGSPQRVVSLELDISGKTLAGSIPSTLSRLSGLQTLNLSNNEFSGRIPVGLRALAALQILDFSNNRLSGSMPTDLGSIASLQTLHLANNSLTGSIPTTLVDLSALRSLSLAGNRFSGCIPNALARVAQNDLSAIELSFCDPVTPTATPTVTRPAPATPIAPVRRQLFLPLVYK